MDIGNAVDIDAHAHSVRSSVFPVTWPMTSSISRSSCMQSERDTQRQIDRHTHTHQTAAIVSLFNGPLWSGHSVICP